MNNIPSVIIGDCVLFTVPKFDRGPSDPKKIMCVIIDEKNDVLYILD